MWLRPPSQTRINRNIVECKDVLEISFKIANIVLIETLWNVKMGVYAIEKSDYAVLIETLWNVKEKTERRDRCGNVY